MLRVYAFHAVCAGRESASSRSLRMCPCHHVEHVCMLCMCACYASKQVRGQGICLFTLVCLCACYLRMQAFHRCYACVHIRCVTIFMHVTHREFAMLRALPMQARTSIVCANAHVYTHREKMGGEARGAYALAIQSSSFRSCGSSIDERQL